MFADLLLEGAVTRIEGPLLFAQRAARVGLNSAVEVNGGDGGVRLGRIAALDEQSMVIEVLQSTAGLSLAATRVRLRPEPLLFGVGPNLLGRIFDSVGRPIDGGPPIAARARMRIEGLAINPSWRALPRDFIETGVSTIDLLNSLVRGQKLPLFSAGGLPHDRLASQIAQRARLRGGKHEDFAVVFAGMGVPHDTAEQFRRAMESSGALGHTVLFLNLADETGMQRLLTPRYALTAAEYVAFVQGLHVLVVMTDMTNYCEALREVSASHGVVPSRKGYPGYMYSDLASIYERAGCIRGLPGTLTQLPILTMPADDIGHPIPDLTGYITEGQIVLDRELDRRGIYPPIKVLPSLSRLMDAGTGEGYTDYRRLREYPVAGGPSTLRESIRCPALQETAERLLSALGWVGVAMVEFKVDSRDGRPKLPEVYPRFWGSLHHAIVCGVDFPFLVCRLALDGDVACVPQYRVGVQSRSVCHGELLHFLAVRERFRLRPALSDFSVADDVLSARDPLPTLGRILSLLAFVWNKDLRALVHH